MYMKEPEGAAGEVQTDIYVGTAVFITALFTLMLGIMPYSLVFSACILAPLVGMMDKP